MTDTRHGTATTGIPTVAESGLAHPEARTGQEHFHSRQPRGRARNMGKQFNMKTTRQDAASTSQDNAPAGQNALEMRAVTKDYGSLRVLHPTDMTVGAHEFVTLLGPSGSGKSTILSIAAGITAPSGGQVIARGVDITDTAANARNTRSKAARCASSVALAVPGLAATAAASITNAKRPDRAAALRAAAADKVHFSENCVKLCVKLCKGSDESQKSGMVHRKNVELENCGLDRKHRR